MHLQGEISGFTVSLSVQQHILQATSFSDRSEQAKLSTTRSFLRYSPEEIFLTCINTLPSFKISSSLSS